MSFSEHFITLNSLEENGNLTEMLSAFAIQMTFQLVFIFYTLTANSTAFRAY